MLALLRRYPKQFPQLVLIKYWRMGKVSLANISIHSGNDFSIFFFWLPNTWTLYCVGAYFYYWYIESFFVKNYFSLRLKQIHNEISYSVCTRIVDVKPHVEINGLKKANQLFVNQQVGNCRCWPIYNLTSDKKDEIQRDFSQYVCHLSGTC